MTDNEGKELGLPWEKRSSNEGVDVYISKFASRGWEVTRSEVAEHWKIWTLSEKKQFASAYSCKPELAEKDFEVLDFIIEGGTPAIWMSLARILARHPNRSRILALFRKQIQSRETPVANYYQALSRMGDQGAVPILEIMYPIHRQEIDSRPVLTAPNDMLQYVDYMACCAALASLGVGDKYRNELKALLQHPDERVRHEVSVVSRSFQLSLAT